MVRSLSLSPAAACARDDARRLAAARVLGLALLAAALAATAPSAAGQCRLADLRIEGLEPFVPYERVAISGDRAAVGAVELEIVQPLRLERATWVPDERIVGEVNSGFGQSVAFVGDWLAVGAIRADGGGRVELYREESGTWVRRAILRTPVPDDGGYLFGLELVANGRRLVVSENFRGGVDLHVFRLDGDGEEAWVHESTLGRLRLRLGALSSSLDGDGRFLAMSPVETGGFYDALVFERTDGAWIERLRVPNGGSVSLDGDTCAIGVRSSVILYERSGDAWLPTQVVVPSGDLERNFGSTLALAGDSLIAGSLDAAFVFDRASDGLFVERDRSEKTEGTLLVDVAADDGLAAAIRSDGAFRSWSTVEDDCSSLCREGNVNATAGAADTLFFDGSVGDAEREVVVGAEDRWLLWMLRPPAGGSSRFVVHANPAAPGADDPVRLVEDHGLFCFEPLVPRGAAPAAVWNGLGRERLLGSSRYFDGSSLPDPPPAPAFLLQLDAGDPANLPPGTVVTFQGLIEDPAAIGPRGFAATNAIVVRVE